jgi:hypothetical protein
MEQIGFKERILSADRLLFSIKIVILEHSKYVCGTSEFVMDNE